MTDPDRVLRPLREAEPAIEQLETYDSPAALTDALRATSHAVERTLRTLLRSDPSTPDAVRLTAMSPDQMTLDAVLTELRRRDLISLGLAGRIHEMRQALDRAERNEVRASDADNAENVVRGVREEVRRLAARESREAAPARVSTVAAGDEQDFDAVEGGRWRLPVLPRHAAAAALVLVLVAIAALFVFGGSSEMEQGVQAFRDDRKGIAEQHFRAALEDDAKNNTARLYLARILREQGRNQEALRVLREAYATDAQDEAVLRELGYLLLQENRPELAADQFRRAVEINPDEPLNWVGVIESLRRSGSAEAEEWLRRAPSEAQTMIRDRLTPRDPAANP